jgi:drug/metabolite transporter (DMT)-like permease
MVTYYIIAAGAVLLTAVSQILLKIGANKSRNMNFFLSYFNPYVILGYFLFVIVTLMNLYAYKQIPLKMAVIFLPFTYVFVSLFSLVLLKEKMTKNQIIGSCIILFGVFIYNISF